MNPKPEPFTLLDHSQCYPGSIGDMKLSVSLTEADIAFLDAEVERGRYASRSAAIAGSIKLARERELVAGYIEAFEEWEDSGAAAAWDSTVGDGWGGRR